MYCTRSLNLCTCIHTSYICPCSEQANAWRRTLVSGKRRLNVDVRLTKNVYYEDEDVVVIVDVNNETGDKIKSISAKLFQKVVLKAPHKVPVTKEQMLAKAKVKEGLPGPNSDGEVEVRVAPTVPDNNNDVCIRDVSKNDSALEKSASFTVETGSGDPSPAHDCKRSLAPTVFFTDPRPERPESLKVSFHVSYSVLVTVSRGHGMGKKIEIQLPFTLGDNVDNMEVTPRRHKSGSLITSSHKSLLSMVGLGVTKEVQALSAYGEEDIVEEQNQQREAKQLEKEEKKAAKQRQADEKEELRAMREKQKQAKRDLRKSRDDLSKSTSKSITPQPNTAGLQDVSRAKMLSPVPKTTEEEVKEKAVDAQYEHQHEARDDGVIMDAKL
ncbi:hypothetical protein SARC_09281 [Sphaeroforma arctica JP610]|uniref:Arrestin C-terminal-like domain-containing protein n=1 Tax=Sphaeroforma arctica JP610 TaxID=667725 RepID=A0A0L0FNB4_9EUKA|nr:hypothetical protein SARC_09281 [Sphaeroforma arctica JP610]KNC78277.1 hypothetical protein SARC_09281 [Sphaeroforma arctica JP610]|eukprot:XP_014152179.1 hypothetical protein SARC_09281 [Sphaeroforma arctica JP610]